MTVLSHLWLSDFRNYADLDLSLSPGRIVVVGRNGQGKSNLLEAIGYLGTLGSFRGAPGDAMIRQGAEHAIIRAELVREDRQLLVEAELARARPNKVQVNKQRLSPARELVGMVPTTIFGPDDLELVKGGPGLRRGYLDDLLVQLHPRNERLRAELERVLKQRNALLRQAKGRLSPEIESTLHVWNAKLTEAGTAWGEARKQLVSALNPRVDEAYAQLAGVGHPVVLRYAPAWMDQGLGEALAAVRDDEVRRGVTLVGPHRDELDLALAGMPARTHASQGEQRTMALALRIAGHHELAASRGTSPLLLLDDVFSELDATRASSLLALLVAEQTFITTAGEIPEVDGEVLHLTVDAGSIR